jgi:periplasmic protein CpxP/Spy
MMKKANLVKTIIGCLLMVLVSTLSFAQQSAQARAEKQTKKLKTDLQLTDDQTAKVQTAIEKRMSQMEAIKENKGSKENRKENMGKAKTAMDEYEATMKTILSPEQYTKFEETREDKKEKFMEKRKNKRGNNK